MSVDLANETIITLAQVGDYLPAFRKQARVSISCALRWVLDGVRLPAGEAVRLEAVRLGGRWLTSVEALQRFAEAQTPRLDGQAAPAPPTPATRERASRRAAEQLERLGI